MIFDWLGRPRALAVCVTALGAVVSASLPLSAQQQPPAPATAPAAAQPPPKPANPFESVPQTQAPAPSATKPTVAGPGAPAQDVIAGIEFRGNRRVPQDTLKALIFTKQGDRYDREALTRDFTALWNTGRFDDIRLEQEVAENGSGWILRFVVTERRVVRTINYEGAKSVTVSEILDRFKERRVGLSVESQYDPNKVQRAAVVLKEFLAERGRQFATVDPQVRQVPPASLEVVFKVDEGPKVKVGNIEIVGNQVFSDRAVRRAMKNLKPIGVPHSIVLENLFDRAYDQSKLEEDAERIRDYYQKRGYFMARATPKRDIVIRDVGGRGIHIPLFYPNKPGKRADITVSVDEGRKYYLNKINAVGVKLFRTPDVVIGQAFGMKPGDLFSTERLQKGLTNLREAYGQFGYIDFVAEPEPQPLPNSDRIDLTLTVDEGKQFFVRRIDISGNTTTRDKVIRREILIDEGQIFSTRLWELSVLRLNQLGYFEQLKKEDAADMKRDTKNNTVDLTLKVKERGKNSIQLSGGVSGIAGSFVQFGYSTNNFLGLGETLGLDAQLGDRIRQVQFSFTEPYLFDKPIQAGFTVSTTRFNYDQGREVSLFSGRNVIPLYNQLGTNNVLNYVSTGYGFTTFASYPLRRSFARLALSYGFNVQNIQTLSDGAKNYFEYLNFRGVGGPNALQGIRTSSIVPSYQYNTVNHPFTPTAGKSLYATVSFAGGPLGGNVNDISPTLDGTYYRAGFKKGHVIGVHGLARFISGYGGKVAPPFNRFYIGGEQDIRGFDIWGISPIGFIPSSTSVNVLNDDGTARQQRTIVNGQPTYTNVTQQVPYYQLIFPGGDTSIVTNAEYRIPIFGPVTLAAFFDAGVNRISLPSQLGLNQDRLTELNGAFPSANFGQRAIIAPGTQKIRTSTGLELKVLLPIIGAPFRVYYAFNPTIVQEFLQPPIAADPSFFPNLATYGSALNTLGQAQPFFERRKVFRFTIGKTF